jgi:ethanolamine utilization protein EutN
MILCKVLGHAVSSRKDERLDGAKLLVVVELEPGGAERDELHVVADTLGAGEGDTVLVVIGSAARMTEHTRSQPIDALVVGIVDSVDVQA